MFENGGWEEAEAGSHDRLTAFQLSLETIDMVIGTYDMYHDLSRGM